MAVETRSIDFGLDDDILPSLWLVGSRFVREVAGDLPRRIERLAPCHAGRTPGLPGAIPGPLGTLVLLPSGSRGRTAPPSW